LHGVFVFVIMLVMRCRRRILLDRVNATKPTRGPKTRKPAPYVEGAVARAHHSTARLLKRAKEMLNKASARRVASATPIYFGI